MPNGISRCRRASQLVLLLALNEKKTVKARIDAELGDVANRQDMVEATLVPQDVIR